jgi:ParB family transcriptional regulator, chromosome partitioning protein
MKRNALGKGLGALLPDPEPQAPGPQGAEFVAANPFEVPIEALEPNPAQPRLRFEPAALEQLAASLRESGMVQPILVRHAAGGRYQIIAGERRWRAAQQLGLTSVPVSVRDVPDDRLLELALVENIQRQELSAIEEAHAYQKLLDSLSLTQEDLAQKLGKERSTVANSIRLLRLPDPIQGLISEGQLTAGQARPLLAIERSEDQIALAHDVVRKGMSAREVEREVAEQRAAGREPAKALEPKRKDANTRAAEERLRELLGTKVEIKRRARGGSLAIAFSTEAELNRIFDWLVRRSRG